MDDDFKKIIKKWEQFQDDHIQVFLPERRAHLIELYERVRLELKDEAAFEFIDKKKSFTIKITANSFLATDDAPALLELIRAANVFRADIKHGRLVFDMWYMCWEWVAKQ